MAISQLLNAPGAPSTAPAPRSGQPAGDGADFARLIQQATPANAGEAGLSRATGDGPQSMTKALLGGLAGGASKLDQLGAESTGDDAPTDAALALGLPAALSAAPITPLPGELTPLTRQIGQAMTGENAATLQAAQGLTAGNGAAAIAQQGLRSEGQTTAQPSSQEFSGLAAIRQRLDAIGQAQRGETAGNASTRKDASGNEGFRAALASGDGAALRHQTLTAQAQHGAQAQIQAQTSAQSSVQPGSGQDFSALVGGDLATAGRGGTEHASAALMATGTGTGTGTAAGNAAPANPTLAGASTATLSAPLASSQWQQGLGQQLVAMQQQGNQRVELHLHPAELGPLSVSLKVDDQLAQAQFASANPHVRAAVEQAIPQLREALEECGIQLGEAMVGEHSQGNDGDGSAESGTSAAGLAGLGENDGERGDLHDASLASRPLMSTSGGVDLYA